MVKTKSVAVFLYLILTMILVMVPNPLEAKKKVAEGFVFEDLNRNGFMDSGEPGIASVVVSNQVDVVQTNERGQFRLPVGDASIIFISKPAGYNTPLDENNLPRFYYIHQPAGSPTDLAFKGIEPTGKLPSKLFFPLWQGEIRDTFNAIVVGDPQTKNKQEVGFYRDQVVTGMLGANADFYLDLGDIMYDDLSLYPAMNKVLARVGIPIYHVQGNHDMNFQALDYTHQAETFKRFYGPDYYSFNYGKVHFVVLNTVKYEGWDPVAKKKRTEYGYTGGIHAQQLTWLQRDLALVPADHLVVLAMHIPPASKVELDDTTSTIIANRQELFKLLENRTTLLALSGHMHFVEYLELTEQDGWHGKVVFPTLTAGSGCGTWWHGPKDAWGLPLGIGTDGSPNGFFRFTFTGDQFKYRFVPSGTCPSEQMRINSPRGTLSRQELSTRRINVNVFAGTPRTRVSFQLDQNPAVNMEQKIMADPFYAQLILDNPSLYTDWMTPTPCAHIWEAPLPMDLTAGIHRLDITVTDSEGDVFTAYQLFEVQ